MTLKINNNPKLNMNESSISLVWMATPTIYIYIHPFFIFNILIII